MQVIDGSGGPVTFTRHPLSACFGDMADDELQSLKDDIEAHGQHEPILIFEDQVLDGWHRYLVVTQLCLPIKKFAFSGTFAEAQERVVSCNEKRKHQTIEQRAQSIVAVTGCRPVGRPLKNNSAPGAEFPEKTAENNSAPGAEFPENGTDSAAALGKKHGIGTRTIERARVVDAAGLGTIVVDGALSAKQAEDIARGKPKKAKKPAKAPVAVAAVAPADDGPEAAELAASEREAAEELAALRKIALSDDKLGAAIAEATMLRALNAVLTERNNGLLNEKASLVKLIKSLQRKVDRLEQPA